MIDAHLTQKLRIAITGGGLAGATLANALVHQPHLDVHLYESAPEFSERGAAVGLAVNAQRALSEILPAARDMLAHAGAVPMNSTRVVVGSGPAAGALVFDLAGTDPGLVVHRAALLRELLAPLPPAVMHASKKLVAINADDTTAGGSVILRFQDGSTERADALIGADGIFGVVRRYVLGADDPAAEPVFGGWWDCRNLVPFEKAKEKLGEEYFKENRQYGWVGDGAFIMHDVLDNGKTIQCVGCCSEDWASDERKKALNREKLEASFATWIDGPIATGMIDLLLDQKEPRGFSQWEHKNAPTYANGRVCIMGDAAHAMTPWQGSGAAQAIEDAMILGTLLAAIKTPEQLDGALRAYDTVRRPRTQRIVESSRITGQIMTGRGAEIGVDPDKMREALATRWAFIHGFDMQKHKEKALTALRQA
ncbi:MAG: hypothetical protein M1830_007186 [Pleopsidium flavum]|nr:MAG: hypothetical protein M1830_007186 [Pleopsidium flavum]